MVSCSGNSWRNATTISMRHRNPRALHAKVFLKITGRHVCVMPAKAGIQRKRQPDVRLDPDFRWDHSSAVSLAKAGEGFSSSVETPDHGSSSDCGALLKRHFRVLHPQRAIGISAVTRNSFRTGSHYCTPSLEARRQSIVFSRAPIPA